MKRYSAFLNILIISSIHGTDLYEESAAKPWYTGTSETTQEEIFNVLKQEIMALKLKIDNTEKNILPYLRANPNYDDKKAASINKFKKDLADIDKSIRLAANNNEISDESFQNLKARLKPISNKINALKKCK
jgi:hypothetical protein